MQECRNFFWNHLLCITFLLAICTTSRHASIKCHIPYHFRMFPWKKYWNEIFSHCVPPPPPKEEGRDLLMGMYTYYVFCGWPLQTLSGWRRKGLHTGLHMQEPTWGFWETTLGQWSGEKILMLIQPYATRPFNHNRSVPNLSKKMFASDTLQSIQLVIKLQLCEYPCNGSNLFLFALAQIPIVYC